MAFTSYLQLSTYHLHYIYNYLLPKLVGAQYATGDQWRNNSRKNEGLEPKQKQHPVVDMTGNEFRI